MGEKRRENSELEGKKEQDHSVVKYLVNDYKMNKKSKGKKEKKRKNEKKKDF